MNFKKVDKEWLQHWNRGRITQDAFIKRHTFANICVKDVGIEPSICIKTLGKSCSVCWQYVHMDMYKQNLIDWSR